MFWTPLIAQALAVERKKDSEMAGHKVFRHFIQLIQLIRYFHRISVNNSIRFHEIPQVRALFMAIELHSGKCVTLSQ